MIPLGDYVTVSPDDTIATAVDVLVESYRNKLHHRTALVVSGTKLIGLLTMRNLLTALDPALFHEGYIDDNFRSMEVTPAVELFALVEQFTERCRKNCNKKVAEVMHDIELVTIDHNATLLEAIHLMIKNKIGLLPVMNGDHVVGIIRSIEIVEEVSNLIHEMHYNCN
jgi:CBS domain-containing protein